MAATKAATNRAIRQEALRDQLSAGGHLQQALVIAKEINEQAATIGPTELQAKKAAADIHFKAVNKYLPDLKSTELTGEGGGPVGINAAVVIAEMTNEEAANVYKELMG